MERRGGFSPADWELAKDQMRAVLVETARRRGTITYAELCARVTAIVVQPHDATLPGLLREISTEDHQRGRAMRTALVVYKKKQRPGRGFFAFAKSLGKEVRDPDQFWEREVTRVYHDWGAAAPISRRAAPAAAGQRARG